MWWVAKLRCAPVVASIRVTVPTSWLVTQAAPAEKLTLWAPSPVAYVATTRPRWSTLYASPLASLAAHAKPPPTAAT